MSSEACLFDGAKRTNRWVFRLKHEHFQGNSIPEDAKTIICVVDS